MENAMMKYDYKNDCWMLDPYITYHSKPNLSQKSPSNTVLHHSNSKRKMKPNRNRTRSAESTTVYTFSMVDASRKPSRSKERRGFWNFCTRYFSCMTPADSESKSSNRARHGRSNSVHSANSSPRAGTDSDSGMNAQDRDESIKAAISYCKNNSEPLVVQN
ncbi:uncharacterized protein LOC126670733 [Mercurialis annua]|uniref:uncharacterized protein LOC126670733 n=1 Tax=Mercurialis annua TaxID=3986 RepID=UPI002160F1A8|nr:uncharacterized protein LOC126670733 [Mercurialis annua]